MLITENQLGRIYPTAGKPLIRKYCKAFNEWFPKYGMTSPKRIAAFLGQIGVESGELKYDEELPSKWNKKDPTDKEEATGTLYEGRKTLGNYVAGDGVKYIGRGIIQITGRYNYNKYGSELGIDLITYPERAKEPTISTRIALQYWKGKDLNGYADIWNLDEITKRINGKAMLHHDKRVALTEKALKILTETNK